MFTTEQMQDFMIALFKVMAMGCFAIMAYYVYLSATIYGIMHDPAN